MVELSFTDLGYIILLVCTAMLPLLVRWRWGLPASFAATLVTLGLCYAATLATWWMKSPDCQECMCNDCAPLIAVIVLAAAVLAGQTLALLWSAVLLVWRRLGANK